jgi:hypothetical protein
MVPQHEITDQIYQHKREQKKKRQGRGERAHEAVALGAPRGAVGDDDGLEDVAVDLEVCAQHLAARLPGEPAHEHLGERGVPVRPAQVVQRRRASAASPSCPRRRRPLRRHPSPACAATNPNPSSWARRLLDTSTASSEELGGG